MSSAPDATQDEEVPEGADTGERHLAVAPEPTDTTKPAEVGADAAPNRSVSDRFDRAVDRVLGKLGWVSPPDMVRYDRPGLGKIWRHARYGRYAAGNHLARCVGVSWAVFALAYTAWVYLKAWLVERPTRAGVAVGLLAVVAATPPGRAVLTVLLWLPHHVISLLTTF